MSNTPFFGFPFDIGRVSAKPDSNIQNGFKVAAAPNAPETVVQAASGVRLTRPAPQDRRRITDIPVSEMTDAQKQELTNYYKVLSQARHKETQQLRATLKLAKAAGIEFHHSGRTTFAFCADEPGGTGGNARPGRVISLATSLCHPNDAFIKWRGEAYAAKMLFDGQATKFKVPSTYMDNLEFVECLGDLLAPETQALKVNSTLNTIGLMAALAR